jgi:hypothetical protein
MVTNTSAFSGSISNALSKSFIASSGLPSSICTLAFLTQLCAFPFSVSVASSKSFSAPSASDMINLNVARMLSAAAFPAEVEIPCERDSWKSERAWGKSRASRAEKASERVLSPVEGFAGRAGGGEGRKAVR